MGMTKGKNLILLVLTCLHIYITFCNGDDSLDSFTKELQATLSQLEGLLNNVGTIEQTEREEIPPGIEEETDTKVDVGENTKPFIEVATEGVRENGVGNDNADLQALIEEAVVKYLQSEEISEPKFIIELKNTVVKVQSDLQDVRIELQESQEEQSKQKKEIRRLRRQYGQIVEGEKSLRAEIDSHVCKCKQQLSPSTAMTSPTDAIMTSPTDVTPSETPVTTSNFSRILAVAQNDVFYQFDLQTHTKSLYTFNSSEVNSVVYASTKGQVIWSNGSLHNDITSCGIFSERLDSGHITPILAFIWVASLAVDNDVLFLATFGTNITMAKLALSTMEYTDLGDVAEYGRVSTAMSLDPTRRLIYSCHGARILKMTYEGTERQIIARSPELLRLTIDSSYEYLYYTSVRTLHKMALNGTVTKKYYLPYYSESIVYDNGLVYIGGWYLHKKVMVLNTTSSVDSVVGTMDSQHIIVCLIP